jgi:hypothetical protein
VTTSLPLCTWTATTTVPWIIIVNGASVTGGGTVEVTALPNTTGLTRSGTMLVANQVVTVTQ